MIKKILCIFFITTFISLHSQEATKFVKVKTLDLKVVPYPWANELSLSINIFAKRIFKDVKFQIRLQYEGRKIGSYTVTVKENEGRYYAKKKFEPLNKPAQEVLYGDYNVYIEMVVEEQNSKFKARWKKFSSATRLAIAQKTFSIGKKNQVQKQQKEIQEFYIERMKELNRLYKILKKQEVVEYRNRGFRRQKWRQWLYTEYLQKINNEKKQLEIRQARVYHPKYNYTLNGMKYYCDLLVRIGKTSTMILYKRHGLKQDATSMSGIDPFAIKSRKSLNKIIEGIHRSSAKEMGISLKKELGFIPPPK
ncbi:hypothetical protein [Candidatus Uabimicrobium amorphum]|uniref:Uncharacterized protein n=1 Tax=Uabimicrobium amorphum TaxID=2596890 RepID=A0A5S9IVP7_UABAM|nr:hypothetical protein [Candidatus Uabimicrobium amorphum]BBM88132.1 hypothetical protein UABAM_06548 [Candidatus Uabimicrobium amorphum]